MNTLSSDWSDCFPAYIRKSGNRANDENIFNIMKVFLALCTSHLLTETSVRGENNKKHAKLILASRGCAYWAPNYKYNRYVNEALLSAKGSTAFLDLGCAECSPWLTEKEKPGEKLAIFHIDYRNRFIWIDHWSSGRLLAAVSTHAPFQRSMKSLDGRLLEWLKKEDQTFYRVTLAIRKNENVWMYHDI